MRPKIGVCFKENCNNIGIIPVMTESTDIKLACPKHSVIFFGFAAPVANDTKPVNIILK